GEKAAEYLQDQGLYASLAEAMETTRYEINPQTGGGYAADNQAQQWRVAFSTSGLRVEPSGSKRPDWQFGLKLPGYGYGAPLTPVAAGRIKANANRFELDHSSLTEWYVNSKQGLEQGFTLAEPPGVRLGLTRLRVALAVSGNLTASLEADGQAINFTRDDGAR